jgi:hypothetical protein
MQYRLGRVTVKNAIRRIKFRYSFLGLLIRERLGSSAQEQGRSQ